MEAFLYVSLQSSKSQASSKGGLRWAGHLADMELNLKYMWLSSALISNVCTIFEMNTAILNLMSQNVFFKTKTIKLNRMSPYNNSKQIYR